MASRPCCPTKSVFREIHACFSPEAEGVARTRASSDVHKTGSAEVAGAMPRSSRRRTQRSRLHGGAGAVLHATNHSRPEQSSFRILRLGEFLDPLVEYMDLPAYALDRRETGARASCTASGITSRTCRTKLCVEQLGSRPPTDFTAPRTWLTNSVRLRTSASRARMSARSR